MSCNNEDRKAKSKLLLETLRSDFEEIKYLLDNPKVYISNYCDELRNRIDLATIEMEKKIASENKLTDKLFLTQDRMINKIKLFEKDCQSELTKKEMNDQTNMDEIRNMINVIEQKTETITDSMDLSFFENMIVLIENCIILIQDKML